MSTEDKLGFRTRAIHVGNPRDATTGAVVPPIHVASTFVQGEAGKWSEFDYSRSGNPTRQLVERTIANLESGVRGFAFASGMAATHAATMLLQQGDHIVAGTDIYGGTYRLFHKILYRSGINITLVNTQNPKALREAMTERTRLVWIETPGNPLLSITDIRTCADIAHQHGAILGVDNTFATPVLTRPLEFGADIVMHSATKYLGGHSDLLGGTLTVRDTQLGERIYFIQNATGGVLSPWDSFLLLRGMKTVALRVIAQSATAVELAKFLQGRPDVIRVLYPGLKDHPGHNLAAQQMKNGFGAMMTFEIEGGWERAKRFVESTRLFQLAVSLGAVESLIEHPASMSHASYDPQARADNGITDGLIRLSVGLEDTADLLTDLTEAFVASAR